jgi:WhiB family transcriptional regulator, redox-sensing transcriptional regulator
MTRPATARSKAAATATLTIAGRWAERALCAQADPDAWFPNKGQRGLAAIATRICGHCPVRAECLDYALSGADTWGGITTGIWAGTTPQERDRLRQRTAAA